MRIQPQDYGNDPVNWRAGDPTTGSDVIRFRSVSLVGNTILLEFEALANQTYTVQYRSSVTSGAWVKLTDVAAEAFDRTVEVSDPVSTSESSRFYRLVSPTQP